MICCFLSLTSHVHSVQRYWPHIKTCSYHSHFQLPSYAPEVSARLLWLKSLARLKLSFYQYFYYCSYSQSCICTTVWSWKSILIWFDLILITLKANLRILESNVKTMLYVGSEIWTVTSGLTKKIQSTDNSLCMVILGVCWLNFIQWRRVWQKRWQRSSIKASASFDRYSPKFVLQSFEWVNVMNVWEGPKNCNHWQ